MKPNNKVLLVSNTAWYLYNFRLPLARALRGAGYEPVFVSPRDAYVQRLVDSGFGWIELKINRQSRDPFVELATLYRFIALYARERPVAVHHFTIKCVIYGGIAARLTRTGAVVNSITGLGHIFVDRGWVTRGLRQFVKLLYRLALGSERMRVIFENKDDLNSFVTLNLVSPDKTSLIRSTGVDLSRFAPAPETAGSGSEPVVLFASRLIAEKGIAEFIGAARICAGRGVKGRFQVAGALDEGNPSSISPEQLAEWKAEGIVDFLGHVDEIHALIGRCAIVVLPSYREGVPRILLEAAAMSKPIVTTNVPGCREVVSHGVNGLLVPAKDPDSLASAIESLLGDEQARKNMGEQGRRRVVGEFGDTEIAKNTLKVYQSLLN